MFQNLHVWLSLIFVFLELRSYQIIFFKLIFFGLRLSRIIIFCKRKITLHAIHLRFQYWTAKYHDNVNQNGISSYNWTKVKKLLFGFDFFVKLKLSYRIRARTRYYWGQTRLKIKLILSTEMIHFLVTLNDTQHLRHLLKLTFHNVSFFFRLVRFLAPPYAFC